MKTLILLVIVMMVMGVGQVFAQSEDDCDFPRPTAQLMINDGAKHTSNAFVNLTLTAQDYSGTGICWMAFSERGDWYRNVMPYQEKTVYRMSSVKGLQSVYAWVWDCSGYFGGGPCYRSSITTWATIRITGGK